MLGIKPANKPAISPVQISNSPRLVTAGTVRYTAEGAHSVETYILGYGDGSPQSAVNELALLADRVGGVLETADWIPADKAVTGTISYPLGPPN